MKETIITIGREFGSGGRLIAQRLAERLNIPFYDKKLIELSARETGFTESFISQTEQQRTNSFLYNLYFSTQNLPVSDQVFIAQAEVIRRVAQEGPCVIVGRCGNYVLRKNPNALHVFIHAPLEERVRRAREEYGLKEGDLSAWVVKQDKGRASYYNHFTTGRWGMCHDYDLTVNSGMGVDKTVQLLEQLVAIREANA